MIAPRVRVSCPRCSRVLRARVEDLGKTGECKLCGQRFRVGPFPATAQAVESVAGLNDFPGSPDARRMTSACAATDDPAAGGQAPSDGTIESTRVTLACPESSFPISQSFVDPCTSASDPEEEDDSFLFSPENQVVLYKAEVPPSADLDAWVDRLALQRDEARADCVRLREENRILSTFREGHANALSQLRSMAEALETVVDERDSLGRETARLQSLVVVLHLALAQAEAERFASERVHRAATDRLNAALDEAWDELESTPARDATPVRARRSRPVSPWRDRLPSLQPQSSGGPSD